MEVGNKTYKCNLCSSRFSDITGIQDHLISSHREHLPEAEESEGEDLLDEEEEEGIRRFDGVEREEVLGRRGREVETRGERIEDMMIQDSTLQGLFSSSTLCILLKQRQFIVPYFRGGRNSRTVWTHRTGIQFTLSRYSGILVDSYQIYPDSQIVKHNLSIPGEDYLDNCKKMYD